MFFSQGFHDSILLSQLICKENRAFSDKIHEFYQQQKESCTLIPFFSYPEIHRFPEAVLSEKMLFAINGLLEGETCGLSSEISQSAPDTLSQAEYLQIPLLTAEINRHGIAIPEILDCWEHFIQSENNPEKIAAISVADGCPALKLGKYQVFSRKEMHTVYRTLSWAFVYAGQPQKAASKAALDGYITARGEILEVCAFFSAAISFAFFQPAKKALSSALYGMSSDFILKVTELSDKHLLSAPGSPIEHAALVFYTIQNTGSPEACMQRLTKYRADLSCFAASGAILAASGEWIPTAEDRLNGKLKFGPAVSRKDLASRFAALSIGNLQMKKAKK